MYMLEQTIENRFKELPLTYQMLITSDYVSEVSEVFSDSLGFSEDRTYILENGLLFYLLFFFTEAELVDYIKANSTADSNDIEFIVSKVCSSLAQFSSRNIYNNTKAEMVAQSRLNQDKSLAQEIIETEASFQIAPGLRTMAGDVSVVTHTPPQSAPVYQSSQADLLSQTPAPPAPPATAPPRWDTEA
jgi:hypothetical protein